MIGEGEPLQSTDGPSKLDQAKEAVQAATLTIKETTQSVADAIEADRQPGAPLDRLARWAREAPLHAVTVAFLVGVCERCKKAHLFRRRSCRDGEMESDFQ